MNTVRPSTSTTEPGVIAHGLRALADHVEHRDIDPPLNIRVTLDTLDVSVRADHAEAWGSQPRRRRRNPLPRGPPQLLLLRDPRTTARHRRPRADRLGAARWTQGGAGVIIIGTLLIVAGMIGLSLWDDALQRDADFDEDIDQALALTADEPALFDTIATVLTADVDVELEQLLGTDHDQCDGCGEDLCGCEQPCSELYRSACTHTGKTLCPSCADRTCHDCKAETARWDYNPEERGEWR